MITIYPSSVASINQLLDYYEGYELKITSNSGDLLVTHYLDSFGDMNECVYFIYLLSYHIKFSDALFIISTHITPNNFECTSPTVEIVLDTYRVYEPHAYEISCHECSIAYLYNFYRNKGIRYIEICISFPNENAVQQRMHEIANDNRLPSMSEIRDISKYRNYSLLYLDLSKDNLIDAINIPNSTHSIHTDDEIINKIITGECEDDWYEKTICHVNGFEIAQVYTGETMNEEIKIDVSKIDLSEERK